MTLTGLARTNTYYFTVISSVGATPYTTSGIFTTVPFYRSIVALTNEWRYTTNNLDGSNWRAAGFSGRKFRSQPSAMWSW